MGELCVSETEKDELFSFRKAGGNLKKQKNRVGIKWSMAVSSHDISRMFFLLHDLHQWLDKEEIGMGLFHKT